MEDRKYLSLREIQLEQKNMLEKIAKFCDDHQITYYICGGTMLGAIRHKGFIPWDDDIDVLMSRPDYEKFHKEVKENNYMIDDKLFVRSFKFDNLLLPFAKVMNPDFELDAHYYEDEFDNLLWVDIFPMDGLPEDNNENRKIYKKVRRLRRLLLLAQVKDEIVEKESKHKWMILPKKILRKIISRKSVRKKIANKMDKLSLTYDYETSKYVGGIVWGYGPHERLLKSELGDCLVDFEDIKVNTMACYDRYLTNLYGDYMKLPPEEKRITHEIKIYRVGEE